MALAQSARGRTRTTHAYVLGTLREAILNGELAGGTHLIQSDLATQLDVSITPVREALRDLAAEGLVDFDPHKGALVRSLDLAEVQELYELRMTLEPIMIRRSIKCLKPERIDHADSLQRQMTNTTSITEWVELNRQFHEAFAEPDNSRLSAILSGLRASSSAYVGLSLGASPDRIKESDTQHAQLVELYRRQDVNAVVALTLQHLESTLATITEAHDRGIL